jgi:DegV family protein with EDD domain
MAKSTNNIVCLTLSKKLSATHDAAIQARDIMKADHPDLNIEIIDSETATGALGFLVLEAARAAHAGKSLTEVVQVVQDMLPRVKFFMSPDTLKYLIRIGRAPKTAIIGNLLQVKPILGMVNRTGLVESLGRTRGKQQAKAKMVDMIEEYIDTTKPVHIIIHYSERIEYVEGLEEMVTSRYNCSEVYVSEFTPVMATAMGPLVGLAFYS